MGLKLGSSGKNKIQPAEEKCYIDKVELAILFSFFTNPSHLLVKIYELRSVKLSKS